MKTKKKPKKKSNKIKNSTSNSNYTNQRYNEKSNINNDLTQNYLDESIKENINYFFLVDNIGDKYYPLISDSVKWSMDEDYFTENKGDFIKLWIKLFFKYPKEYVESFISNSYGYYYPEAREDIVSTTIYDNGLGLIQQPKYSSNIIDKLVETTKMRNIPVVDILLFSIGTTFWIIIVCLGYVIYSKNYKMILVYIPIIVLWLTLIASPVYCEFRYAYPLFTTLPILIALNFQNKGEE